MTQDLEVRGLEKSFGDKQLWTDVSFTLQPGDIMALRGESGSGKSTLLNAIGLLTDVDAGMVAYAGRNLRASRRAVHKTRVSTISFLFQDYALVEDATVKENLDIAGRPRLFARARSYSTELARVGLPGFEDKWVYTMSGGEQQRLALARIHVRPTPVILADEPTAALDSKNEQIVLDSLSELAAAGRIVIIATHSDTVAAIAHKTLWLRHGHHQWEEQ